MFRAMNLTSFLDEVPALPSSSQIPSPSGQSNDCSSASTSPHYWTPPGGLRSGHLFLPHPFHAQREFSSLCSGHNHDPCASPSLVWSAGGHSLRYGFPISFWAATHLSWVSVLESESWLPSSAVGHSSGLSAYGLQNGQSAFYFQTGQIIRAKRAINYIYIR